MLIFFYITYSISFHYSLAEFFEACQKGIVKKVKEQLKLNVPLNQTDTIGHTGLFYAVKNEHLLVVQVLINAGADTNLDISTYPSSPLHQASRTGNISIAQLLINAQAHINKTDYNHMTPLHLAAQNNHKAVVCLLLTAQASLNILSKDKRPPLYYALVRKNIAIARLLIQKGASLTIKAEDKDKVAERLSDLIDIAKVPEKTFTLYSITSDIRYLPTIINKSIALSCKDQEVLTPLHWACAQGHLKIVSKLLSYRVPVNLQDNFKKTPLIYATINGHLPIVKLLLFYNANSQHEDEDGYTAYNYAADKGCWDIAALLIVYTTKKHLIY